jgi:GTP-binding protein Era
MTQPKDHRTAPESFRCGAIAVIGRPNVGKSTLVNALVGAKVSIVAPKPQTTRHRILGIATRDHAQLVLLDTPGLHRKEPRAINRQLNRTARAACSEAHAVLLVCEAARWTEEDDAALDIAVGCGVPVVLAMNKVDKLDDKRTLLPRLSELAARHAFAALVPISARKNDGLAELERALIAHLPQGEPLFDADAITDRSERFIAAELIREQVVRQLHEELPFSATVEVERFKQTKARTEIGAVIWVERDGQKAIVVGRGGAQIKRIGMAARAELEAMLGGPVFLELWARVREQWSDDEAALRRFGYAD